MNLEYLLIYKLPIHRPGGRACCSVARRRLDKLLNQPVARPLQNQLPISRKTGAKPMNKKTYVEVCMRVFKKIGLASPSLCFVPSSLRSLLQLLSSSNTILICFLPIRLFRFVPVASFGSFCDVLSSSSSSPSSSQSLTMKSSYYDDFIVIVLGITTLSSSLSSSSSSRFHCRRCLRHCRRAQQTSSENRVESLKKLFMHTENLANRVPNSQTGTNTEIR